MTSLTTQLLCHHNQRCLQFETNLFLFYGNLSPFWWLHKVHCILKYCRNFSWRRIWRTISVICCEHKLCRSCSSVSQQAFYFCFQRQHRTSRPFDSSYNNSKETERMKALWGNKHDRDWCSKLSLQLEQLLTLKPLNQCICLNCFLLLQLEWMGAILEYPVLIIYRRSFGVNWKGHRKDGQDTC